MGEYIVKCVLLETVCGAVINEGIKVWGLGVTKVPTSQKSMEQL